MFIITEMQYSRLTPDAHDCPSVGARRSAGPSHLRLLLILLNTVDGFMLVLSLADIPLPVFCLPATNQTCDLCNHSSSRCDQPNFGSALRLLFSSAY